MDLTIRGLGCFRSQDPKELLTNSPMAGPVIARSKTASGSEDGIGFNRLGSILDPSKNGHQPMCNCDGSVLEEIKEKLVA